MRAAVLRASGSLAPEEWPRPEIGDGELLLRLRGCGLCGSDVAKIAAPPTAHPMVVGHEVVGDVVAAGIGAPFAVGERVVVAHHVPCGDCHYCHRGSASMCRAFKASNLDPGGFAEFVRVPVDNARHATFRLPGHVSDEAASFVEPLGCCLRAVKRAGVAAGDTAVVFVTGGGVAVLPWAAATVRDGGAIHFFAGGGGAALPLPLSALYSRELTVTATYSSSPVELREAFDLIADGAVRTGDLVSHRVSLARLAEGVALVQRHEALKVYVTP